MSSNAVILKHAPKTEADYISKRIDKAARELAAELNFLSQKDLDVSVETIFGTWKIKADLEQTKAGKGVA